MQVQETVGYFDIRRFGGPRSPGPHVTEVLREVAIKLRVMDKSDDEEDLDLLLLKYPTIQPGNVAVFNRIMLGLCWEDGIAKHVPYLAYHFGEIKKDGVSGNPDGMIVPPASGPRVYESKVTWKTANKKVRPIRKEWLWMKQVGCYCYMMETLEAELHVFYVNGDYRGSGPLYVIYNLTFEPEELEATWRIVQTHKHLLNK